MRQMVNVKGNSRIGQTVGRKADSTADCVPFQSRLSIAQPVQPGSFGRCVIANLLLMLAIVCKLGFSDVVATRPANDLTLGATVVMPACADWIGDLIDVLGGGGDDDEDEGENEPREP